MKDEIKARIVESGYTMSRVVSEINKKRDAENQTTTQNLSNKLSRETLKYKEAQEIAEVIGYKIEWIKEK
ncbi:LLM class flavin-dependent oxidoreductase [Desulfosporosinus sp. SB140]|uniref:LLM class flavin-dependent oxidoreductase n=1 Tax=Desulfosporosinus paludis TaxID=3115649 RepID=UPI00388EF8D1